MNAQPEKQEWQGIMHWRPHQPVFGRFSLWVLGAAAAITVVSFLIPLLGSYGESGMGFIVLGLGLGGIMCIANVVIALIGLARRESPRWPAIIGLVLSVLPALGGVYLLCGAPW
jgi:hypothetical protein